VLPHDSLLHVFIRFQYGVNPSCCQLSQIAPGCVPWIDDFRMSKTERINEPLFASVQELFAQREGNTKSQAHQARDFEGNRDYPLDLVQHLRELIKPEDLVPDAEKECKPDCPEQDHCKEDELFSDTDEEKEICWSQVPGQTNSRSTAPVANHDSPGQHKTSLQDTRRPPHQRNRLDFTQIELRAKHKKKAKQKKQKPKENKKESAGWVSSRMTSNRNSEVYMSAFLALRSYLPVFAKFLVPPTFLFNITHDATTNTFCAQYHPRNHQPQRLVALMNLPFMDTSSVNFSDPNIVFPVFGKTGAESCHSDNLESVMDSLKLPPSHSFVLNKLIYYDTSPVGLTLPAAPLRNNCVISNASKKNSAKTLNAGALCAASSEISSDPSSTILGRGIRLPVVPLRAEPLFALQQ